jgi:hypothetical protein
MTWLSPTRDCRVARPFLALLFGRVVNARLRAKAAYFLDEPEGQNNMRGVGTHIAGIARRHAIPEPLGGRLILDEQTAEPKTSEHGGPRLHPDASRGPCSNKLR